MDWFGAILSIIGIGLNAKKVIYCWPVWVLSTVFWGIYSIQTHQWALLAVEVSFFAANLYGWRAWWLDEQATVVTEFEIAQRKKRDAI